VSAAARSTLRSLALVLGLAVAASAVAGLGYGRVAAEHTLVVLAPLGVVTILLASWLGRRRALLGGLRRQFTVAAVVAVGAWLAGTALFALRMFVSDHDAFFTALLAVYAGVLGWWAGALLASGVLDDVRQVRDGLRAVGEGDRDVAFATSARDEIADLAASAQAMEERLAAEERTRRELVAAVSHDLRTPVTNLRLLAEAVEDGVIPEERRREYLSQLGVHVRRLGALIDDLFELSRLEAGDIRWTAERVDVEGLVAEAVEAMRPQADAGAIAVRAELPADLGAAHADPEQLQRVLYNLLQNAVRHTPADGSVVVRAARTPGAVEIEVADTGPGIPAGERERVFEPFTRGDASRSSDGAGLGLAIARAIVEAHGGRIWLAEAAAGTRVRFSVPAA
jgi:signal transduction histidine kinase